MKLIEKLAKSGIGKMLKLMQQAMCGDMVLSITPATCSKSARSTAWTRQVVIELRNAAGDIHEWCNQAFTTKLTIADTSSAGTASIASTTLTFEKGRATITVSGNAASWVNGDTDTLTLANLTILGFTVTGGTSVETITT